MNPFHWLYDKAFPLVRFIYERVLGHEWVSQVTSGLWLGGAPLYPRDYKFIVDNQIAAVLNIRAEREDDTLFYQDEDIRYLQLKVLDMIVPPEETITAGIEWMHQQHQQGRTIFVHCAKGRSRSAILAAAYLMRYEDMSLEQAHALLQSKRQLTNLTPRHLRQLERWWQTYGEPATT